MIRLKRNTKIKIKKEKEPVVLDTTQVVELEPDEDDDFDDDDDYYTDEEFDYDDDEEEVEINPNLIKLMTEPSVLESSDPIVVQDSYKDIHKERLVNLISQQVTLLEDGLDRLTANDIDDDYNIAFVIKNLKGIISSINA